MSDRFVHYKAVAYTDHIITVAQGRCAPPIKAFLAPTSRCQFDCPHCFRKQQDQIAPGDITLERAVAIISSLAEMGCEGVSVSGGGEPALHPYFLKIIEAISRERMFVDITTNGELLPAATAWFADSIRVSFDAGDQSSYIESHGVSPDTFDRTLNNIVELIGERHACQRHDFSGRKLPQVGMLFVATATNFTAVAGFIDLCNQLGVDYGFIRPSWRLRSDGVSRDHVESIYRDAISASAVPIYVGGTSRSVQRCFAAALIPAIRWDGVLMRCQSHQDVAVLDLDDYASLEDAWLSGVAQQQASKVDPAACANVCCYSGFNLTAQHEVMDDAIVRCMI